MPNDDGGGGGGAADWSELHGDLLDQIVEKVRCCLPICDYIRFGGVCSNWRWIQIRNHDDKRGNREMIKFPDQTTPVLLIPYPSAAHSAITAAHLEDEEDVIDRFYNPKDTWLGLDHTRLEKPTRTIYSLYDGKVHNDDIQLPVPYYLNVRGSSHGWLIAIREDEDFSVRLLNPFRSVDNEIQLPPLTTLTLHYDDQTLREIIDSGYFLYGSYFLRKAVVSASPSSVSSPSDIVVMILYDNLRTAFCRPGDASWTTLPTTIPYDYQYVDATFYKGQFYAIEFATDSGVVAFDVTSFHRDDHPLPILTEIASCPTNVRSRIVMKKYLVESGGDLLQVRRSVGDDPDALGFLKTLDFQVFKLCMLPPESNEWVELHTLGGHTLFLGDNASISLLTPPDGHGCKPNCIYFTDDLEERYIARPSFGPYHMGVFSLEDRSFEPHYQMESKIIMPNAIWIQPML